jgi:CheY-like chemotaxis protein
MRTERATVPLAPSPGGGRLLVVDDDPDVRDSLERALRHAGYAVTTAVHGAGALDSVARSDCRTGQALTPGVPQQPSAASAVLPEREYSSRR